MQIIEWQDFIKNGLPLKGLPAEKSVSMTVGVFDGVHRGHKSLLEKVVSHNKGSIPVVVTFRTNYKGAGKEVRDIQSFQERIAEFEKLGIQIVIAVDFTDEFKRMPGMEFLETLTNRCNIGFFAAGRDFRCGYNLDTDTRAIRNFFVNRGIAFEIVPQVMEGFAPISSSRIRASIALKDTKLARKMLGRN